MKPTWWDEAEKEADKAIEGFTEKLRGKLAESPEKILRRKNPFLLRVRDAIPAEALATMVMDAYASSSEETMFGHVLESIAIAICERAKGGRKSVGLDMDLEYEEGQTRVIVQIKSGPNWGNASQHKALKRAFKKAKEKLREGKRKPEVRCVEGICYGPSAMQDKDTYQRIVGRCFWEEISNWEGTASGVMGLLGKHASNGLSEVRAEAHKRMVGFLSDSGVAVDDRVQWDKLLDLVMKGKKA